MGPLGMVVVDEVKDGWQERVLLPGHWCCGSRVPVLIPVLSHRHVLLL